MQAKGIIKVLLIILAVIALYQLSFTYIASNFEKKADQFAAQKVGIASFDGLDLQTKDSLNTLKKQFKREYMDSIGPKKAPLFYGFLGLTYNKCMENQINLGLDLKGGMSVVLEIDVADVLKSLSNNPKDPQLLKAIEDANLLQQQGGENFVASFQKAYEKNNPSGKLASLFMSQTFEDRFNYNSTNDEVVAELNKEVDAAVTNTFKVLQTRIDRFGVVQPNISLEEATNRIVLELPGVEDPARVRRIITETAELGFWDTWENREVIDYMVQANDALKDVLRATKQTDSTNMSAANAGTDNGDGGLLGQLAAEDSTQKNEGSAVKDSTQAEEAAVAEEGDDFNPLFELMSLNIYSGENGQRMAGEGPTVGFALGKDIDRLNSYFQMERVKSVLPQDLRLLWSAKPVNEESGVYALYAIKARPDQTSAPLAGEVITNASQDFQQGTPSVTLSMNGAGTDKWKRMTEEASNKDPKASIAIVLDNRVFSAPRVNEPIPSGTSVISGSMSIEEAQDLANILKAGKLDAKTSIIEESVVGPTLGAESIRKGMMALLIAFVLVILFMLFYYNKAGFIADLALLANVFFIFGAVADRHATLTLPGLAGLVLTIGMAVDANVIIFERIKEELSKGKSLRMAIADGFNKSYSAIIDANVTTLFTAFILLFFGEGPIKGFGTILFIGIISSVITAVLLGRILIEDVFFKGDGSIKFSTGLTDKLFNNFNFKFVDKAKVFFAISNIVMVIALAAILFRGFDFGVDFKGGRNFVVNFDQAVSAPDIQKEVAKQVKDVPVVKSFGGTANRVQITTSYLVEDKDEKADSIVTYLVYTAVKGNYTKTPTFDEFKSNNLERTVKVGSSIADDIKSSAWKVSLLAALGIFIYILFRFRKWQYGAAALVATLHDTIITLGLFAIFKGLFPFSLEVDQAIVAAILTLIGYSINDTVIVFDRIREFFAEHPTTSKKVNVDNAINSTLSRTIMTSFTTLITVIIIFLFGGDAVKGFSFALLFGIVIGTYSSIFVAAPVALWLMGKSDDPSNH